MSRIGKKPVVIPAGVTVDLADGNVLTVKGPKGELTRKFNQLVKINVDAEITVEPVDASTEAHALQGLTRTLINNMIIGVSEGYSKTLEIVGVGYRASLKGSDLEMLLGYSHPVLVKPQDGITFEVPNPTTIVVKGISKEQVGQVAADIRKWRAPEPYKGKGVRYQGEVIRRKLGKAAS
jgi:large subunit ribosomal protein L6